MTIKKEREAKRLVEIVLIQEPIVICPRARERWHENNVIRMRENSFAKLSQAPRFLQKLSNFTTILLSI